MSLPGNQAQDVRVDAALLERFMIDVLAAAGVPREDAAVSAEVLIASDLRGIDSHGISRLKPIYYDRIKDGVIRPTTEMEVVKEGPTTAVVDGHHGVGHVIAKRSMELAMRKAKDYGMGMVAVRNSTHYGIAGYYVMMAAEAGMVGMTGTNARPSIAPTFGVENMLGTNPLTFGMPTDEGFPFILDCATSTAQRGKIEVYARKEEDIPEGWVIDDQGQIRTDSQQILVDLVKGGAALTPIGGVSELTGGHKGYGYATVVELLSAALQGGSFLRMLTGFDEAGDKTHHCIGHFFLAIDVTAFTELEAFQASAGSILRELRASKKAADQERIYTAGEKEYLMTQERKEKGIPLNKNLQDELRDLRDTLGLDYDFPF